MSKVRIKLDPRPPDAELDYHVNLGPQLADDDTLTGSPTIVDEAGVLTISGKALVTAEYTHGAQTVAANRGVKFNLAGGVDGTAYSIKITVSTTDGETLVVYCDQTVNDGA